MIKFFRFSFDAATWQWAVLDLNQALVENGIRDTDIISIDSKCVGKAENYRYGWHTRGDEREHGGVWEFVFTGAYRTPDN